MKCVDYLRERIHTSDDDFIDLDWSKVGSDKAVIISHGLESCSQASYMRGMIKAFNRRGWDGVAFNFRGCSGEPNKLFKSYHSGATEDLHTVICHLLDQNHYKKLSLVGFSLGGNLTLKYVGEQGHDITPLVHSAAAISVPCDLESCAYRLAESSNRIYMRRFIRFLKKKIKIKSQTLSANLHYKDFKAMRTFKEFDELYTAPAHGFASAEDYWSQCSSKQFISGITIPTLLINALDDPFLTKECYPFEEAEKSEYFFLETPRSGGHVGFIAFDHCSEYWHETRVVSFATN
ncbi:MAG: YheT family hydrolase [Candidatus Scalinduaceae bacterium]